MNIIKQPEVHYLDKIESPKIKRSKIQININDENQSTSKMINFKNIFKVDYNHIFNNQVCAFVNNNQQINDPKSVFSYNQITNNKKYIAIKKIVTKPTNKINLEKAIEQAFSRYHPYSKVIKYNIIKYIHQIMNDINN